MQKLVAAIVRFMGKYALQISLVLLVAALSVLVYARFRLIYTYHPDSGGIESNVIYGIQRIMAGMSLYQNPSDPPYAIMMYSPIYYHLVAWAGMLFGLDPDQPIQVHQASRWVSFILNLGFVAMIPIILKRIFKIEWLLGIVVGLFMYLFMRTTEFSRPDSLYNLFFLFFVYLFARYCQISEEKQAIKYLLFAAGMATLNVFAKQSGVLIPFIVLFYVGLWKGNLRHFLIAAGGIVVSFAVLVFLISDDVNNFFLNVFQGINNGVDPDWFFRKILLVYLREIIVWTALGFFLAFQFLQKSQKSEYPFIGWALIGTFLFATITALKWGSMPSYYLRFLTLTVMGWVVYLFGNDGLKADDFKMESRKLLVLCVVIFTILFEGRMRLYDTWKVDDKLGYEEAGEVRDYLHNTLNLQEGEHVMILLKGSIMIDESYLPNFLYRNAIFPQKDLIVCCTFSQGKFNYKQFKTDRNKGLVKYIVNWRKKKHHRFMGVKFEGFEHVADVNQFAIYQLTE